MSKSRRRPDGVLVDKKPGAKLVFIGGQRAFFTAGPCTWPPAATGPRSSSPFWSTALQNDYLQKGLRFGLRGVATRTGGGTRSAAWRRRRRAMTRLQNSKAREKSAATPRRREPRGARGVALRRRRRFATRGGQIHIARRVHQCRADRSLRSQARRPLWTSSASYGPLGTLYASQRPTAILASSPSTSGSPARGIGSVVIGQEKAPAPCVAPYT